jgi:hypothetical protein
MDEASGFEHGRAAQRLTSSGRKRTSVGLNDHGPMLSIGVVAAIAVASAWIVLGGAWSDHYGHFNGNTRWLGADAARPTPQPAANDVPLGTPVDPPPNPGEYRFLVTQPDSDDPVTYDPCRPIPIVIYDYRAPSGSVQLLRSALDKMTEVTGFQFEIERVDTILPDLDRPAYQPDRWGDRWAPVEIVWSDVTSTPDLEGAAGFAGSQIAVAPGTSTWMYVSGSVVLDGPYFDQIMQHPLGWMSAESTILHELGHLLGLDHVDDRNQLMSPDRRRDIVAFGTGDLAGLHALSTGPCVPRL